MMRSFHGAWMAVAGCVIATGCASLPAPAHKNGAVVEAGEVERVRGERRKLEESSRRLVARYREPGRLASSNAGDAADERPGHLSRTRIRAPAAADAVLGPVSGGKNIAAHFNGVPLRVAVSALATLTGASVVVAGDVADEELTLRVTRSPWRSVLAAVAQTHGWTVRDDAGLVRILGKPDGDSAAASGVPGKGVDLLQFFHIAPGDLKKAAMPLFADSESKPVMSVDERTASLVVKGTPDDVALIAALAERLDRPVRQVLIETFIVEAGKGFEKSLGARLGLDYLDAGGSVRVGGVLGSGGRIAVDLPIASPAAGIEVLLDGDRLKLELAALEREGKTRIISNPRIFTLNGHEALIFQGDEVPYSSVSESGTQTEFKEAGVRLAVVPVIVGNGDLILDVTVNKDTVDTRVQNPPITRRQIKTRLLVADGAMVVIGGIYFDTRVNAETRVPLLGRLPLIGRAFRRSQKTRDFKELLVFIAPKIVEASS